MAHFLFCLALFVFSSVVVFMCLLSLQRCVLVLFLFNEVHIVRDFVYSSFSSLLTLLLTLLWENAALVTSSPTTEQTKDRSLQLMHLTWKVTGTRLFSDQKLLLWVLSFIFSSFLVSLLKLPQCLILQEIKNIRRMWYRLTIEANWQEFLLHSKKSFGRILENLKLLQIVMTDAKFE